MRKNKRSEEAEKRRLEGIKRYYKDLPEKEKKRRKRLAKRRWKEKGKKGWNIAEGENHVRYNPNRNEVGRFGMNFTKGQYKRLLLDKCEFCGSTKKLELDHKIAVINGGTNKDSNAQTLCKKCNQKKRIQDLALCEKRGKFGGYLKKDNTEPIWVRKTLEGVTTRGQVYRKKGTKYLRIEVTCATCGKKILRQPNQVKRVKNSFCSYSCQGKFAYKQRKRDTKLNTFIPRQ